MNITLATKDKVYKAGKASVETMELKGYTLIEELFVDNSRMGADDEPALTVSQFERELTRLLTEHGTLTAKITNVGQFQVYIGLFKRTSKSIQVKRIANNVLQYLKNGSVVIRLYDTDIVKVNDYERTIQLFNGGFDTVTTKKWINKYLPNGYVFQKGFKWYVKQDNKTIPFTEGMKLSY